MSRYGRSFSREVRFHDYRTITARFDSQGTCGHAIQKGDQIGYARHGGKSHTSCPDCWAKWSSENAEADRYEEQHSMCSDHGGSSPGW